MFFEYLEGQPGGVSWMSVTPVSGTVEPGQSVEFNIIFNADDISKVLSAQILVTTNDQLQPRKAISVNLFNNDSRAQCLFFQGTDNENNVLGGVSDDDIDVTMWDYYSNHPIEFNIFVTETTINSAILSIYAWDVDQFGVPPPQIDSIYFNGIPLGFLNGNNNQWSTSVFALNPAWVNGGAGNAGKNLVRIYVDSAPGSNGRWLVEIDWGQIAINDCAGEATIRYANLDATCVDPGDQVCVDIEVDSERPSHNIRVEYNLRNENNIIVDGGSYTYTTEANENDPFQRCFTVPANATPGSTYNVVVIVYDVATSVQEDIEIVPLGIAPCAPPVVPVSNWALFIGIALIVTFAVIRFRRMI
jgi:hypothetical protein